MTEPAKGFTGECCKEDGTYVSEGGSKQYFAEGECFGPCPANERETHWLRVT